MSYSRHLLEGTILERDERDRRDEVAILRVKLNAENAVRMMVEKLVSRQSFVDQPSSDLYSVVLWT
jgi:hypothetical protein